MDGGRSLPPGSSRAGHLADSSDLLHWPLHGLPPSPQHTRPSLQISPPLRRRFPRALRTVRPADRIWVEKVSWAGLPLVPKAPFLFGALWLPSVSVRSRPREGQPISPLASDCQRLSARFSAWSRSETPYTSSSARFWVIAPGFDAITTASAVDSPRSCSSATRRVRKPIRYASSAPTVRAVMSRSLACESPTRSGSRAAPAGTP